MDALNVARMVHINQRYYTEDPKDQTPYLCHLMGVAARVSKFGGTEDEVIAALLHDTLEDQSKNLAKLFDTEFEDSTEIQGVRAKAEAYILRKFGQNVLNIIIGCTDAPASANQGLGWREMKQKKLDFYRNEASPSIRLVTIADKLDNLETIIDRSRQLKRKFWDGFAAGGNVEDRLWFSRAVVSAMQEAEAKINPQEFSDIDKKRCILLQKLDEKVVEFETRAFENFPSLPWTDQAPKLLRGWRGR